MKSEMQRSRNDDRAAAATAIKRDILHPVDAAGFRLRTEAALLQNREETQLALDLAQQGLRGCILGSDKIRSRRVQKELPS